MLVLSRKANEKIRIGDNITITILRLKGKTVRIGIEAPGTVPVLRGELTFDRPEEESEHSNEPKDEPRKRMVGIKPQKPAAEAARIDEWPREPMKVSHTRVPRSRVATVLPQMLGEAGPLRAMLDRRGAAGEF